MESHGEALEARLEALEAEVAALRAEKQARDVADMSVEPAPDRMTRRRLLTGGGIAVAGAAAALASPELTGSAAAATGDNVVLGTNNTANAKTSITGTVDATGVAPGPTLQLQNLGYGAPLRLLPATDPLIVDAAELETGDLYQLDGFLFFAWDTNQVAFVHDSSWANTFMPISPLRILDTQPGTPNGSNFHRALVTNGSGKFDASGRLIGGQSINIRLNSFTVDGTAVAGNFAAFGSSSAGYLTVWDTSPGPRPLASLVNFGAGQTIANWAVIPTGFDSLDRDSISIYASRSTHVVLDISGVIVGGYENLAGAPLSASSAARSSRTTRDRQRPTRTPGGR